MKSSRLTAMHVHIIGGVVLLVVILIVFFAMIRPKNQDTEVEKTAAASAASAGGTEEDNRKTAADLVKEKKATVQIAADWSVYSKKYMPDLNWDKDLLEAFYMSNKINEIPAQWGKWVTNWYDVQRPTGVERGPGQVFPVPSLATDPNGIANLTSITFPSPKEPWKVTVICKTFDDAMAHLRRFNGMEKHGMPVIDHVSLSGHSPELVMNYDLSLYVIPGQAPPPLDPRIGAGTAVGGGGFGGGGVGPIGMGGGGGPAKGGAGKKD